MEPNALIKPGRRVGNSWRLMLKLALDVSAQDKPHVFYFASPNHAAATHNMRMFGALVSQLSNFVDVHISNGEFRFDNGSSVVFTTDEHVNRLGFGRGRDNISIRYDHWDGR